MHHTVIQLQVFLIDFYVNFITNYIVSILLGIIIEFYCDHSIPATQRKKKLCHLIWMHKLLYVFIFFHK